MANGRWALRRRTALLGAMLALVPATVPAVPHIPEVIGTWGTPTFPLLGCRGIAVSADGLHAYVATYQGTVVVFARAASGEITFVGFVEDGVGGVDGLDNVSAVTLSPDGAHVYVTSQDENAVTVFSRNALTGLLTYVETERDGVGGVDGLSVPRDLALSPDGAHVYVAGAGDNAVAIFARDAGTGALTYAGLVRDGVGGVDGLASPLAVTVAPDGDHVYATSDGENALATFARDAGTGALTFVEAERDGVGGVDGLDSPYDVLVSPDGAHVYVASSFQDRTIAAFARDAGTGALTFVETEALGGSVRIAYALAISPDGAHLYTVGNFLYDHGLINRMDRNPVTGALTFADSVEYYQRGAIDDLDGIAGARAVALNPDGANLYVVTFPAFNVDGNVAVFDRDGGSGGLTLAQLVTSTDGAIDLALSPDGAHAYAVTGEDGYISAPDDGLAIFTRDAGDASLTFVEHLHDIAGGITGLDEPRAVAVSPDGGHVYVVSHALYDDTARDDAVVVFARDAGTGLLTFVEAQFDGQGGIDGLNGATEVTVSADGAHVYVASIVDDAIAVFARDAGTGALTFVEAERDGVAGVDGLSEPAAIALSPDDGYLYVAAGGDSAVAVFARDALTGALTFVEVERDEQNGVEGIRSARALAFSPDGAHVYVAGFTIPFNEAYGSVAVFARDAGTGALDFVEFHRDLHDGISGLDPRALQVSADGGTLYALGATLVTFARSTLTGRLGFMGARGDVAALDLALTADGVHLYTATGSSVNAFRALTQGYGGCTGPLTGCRGSSAGVFRLVDAGGKVLWRWLRGDATDPGDFGDPEATTHYALCIYDESGPTPSLLLRALVPAAGTCTSTGRPCWKPVTGGLKYHDRFRTPEGIQSIRLKAGAAGEARIILVANGTHVEHGPLPFGTPVRVQLETSAGECWEATYSDPAVNDTRLFQSRPD